MLNCVCRCFNKFVPSGLPKVQLVPARELERETISLTAVTINHFCLLYYDKVIGQYNCCNREEITMNYKIKLKLSFF